MRDVRIGCLLFQLHPSHHHISHIPLHFRLLCDLLRSQNSIPAAVGLLGSPTIRHMPIQPAVDTCGELKEVVSRELEPQVGIMTARAN